jgi:hypothetical protein
MSAALAALKGAATRKDVTPTTRSKLWNMMPSSQKAELQRCYLQQMSLIRR